MAIYWNRPWNEVTETWNSAVGNWGSVGYDPTTASLTLTGYGPPIPYSFVIDAAALSLTGYIPIALENIPDSPGKAALVLAGFAPLAVENIPMFPGKGDLTSSTSVPAFGITYKITVENGVLILEPQEPEVQHRAPLFKPSIQII
mgnify:FL=1